MSGRRSPETAIHGCVKNAAICGFGRQSGKPMLVFPAYFHTCSCLLVQVVLLKGSQSVFARSASPRACHHMIPQAFLNSPRQVDFVPQ